MRIILAAILLVGFAPSRAGAQTPDGAMQVVVVKPGDTLWSIAHRYLKDPARWDEILKHNRLPTNDPTVALPGMTLRVPLTLIKNALRAAHLVSVVNQVLARRLDSADWKGARMDMELFEGDSLRTLEDSKARVKFLDKELLNMEPNSMAVIKPADEDADVVLRSGSVFAGRARVITGNARITPRTADTRYAASIEADMTTRVEVYKGRAGVEAQGSKVEVSAGQQTRVAPGLAPEVPKKIANLGALQARALEFAAAESAPDGAVPTPRKGPAIPSGGPPAAPTDAAALRGDIDSLSVGEPILGYHVQAASDKEFRHVLFDRKYDNGERFAPADAALAPGAYWWRIAAVDLLGTEGPYGKPRYGTVGAKTADETPAAGGSLAGKLTVLSPDDGSQINADSVRVAGTLSDDRLRLEINGKPARIDGDGNFSTSLPLKPGVNEIVLVVSDGKGGSARVVRRVTRL
jgi:hypothetical protein